MIDIEKIAKRLIPEENLIITHAALGILPVWDILWGNVQRGSKTIEGDELFRRLILLNKKGGK